MKLSMHSREIINRETEIILKTMDQVYVNLPVTLSSETMTQIAIAIYHERKANLRLVKD